MLRAYAASPLLRREVKLLCVGVDPLCAGEQSLMQRLGIADRVIRIGGADSLLGSRLPSGGQSRRRPK